MENVLEMGRRPLSRLDPDPDLGFAGVGVRALRELADSCEAYQVRRLRQAGYSWAKIGSWAGVTPQALHKETRQH